MHHFQYEKKNNRISEKLIHSCRLIMNKIKFNSFLRLMSKLKGKENYSMETWANFQVQKP